jgi:hypothetical protein
MDTDVVWGVTFVADELDALGQDADEFGVDLAGDGDRGKGPIDGKDAIEKAVFALLNELVSIGGCGPADIGDLLDMCPFLMGAVKRMSVSM